MLQLMLCPVLVLMYMVMMKVCPALLLMLMKMMILCFVLLLLCFVLLLMLRMKMKTLSHVLLLMLLMTMKILCPVLLLMLVMMICFLLLLMSLCHTHPDFFKHHRKHVQTYERRHMDKRQTNHLLTYRFMAVSVFWSTDCYRVFFFGGGICTELICAHDMRSITAWVPKHSGKTRVRTHDKRSLHVEIR